MKREAQGAGLKNPTELDSFNRRDSRDSREKKLTEERLR